MVMFFNTRWYSYSLILMSSQLRVQRCKNAWGDKKNWSLKTNFAVSLDCKLRYVHRNFLDFFTSLPTNQSKYSQIQINNLHAIDFCNGAGTGNLAA